MLQAAVTTIYVVLPGVTMLLYQIFLCGIKQFIVHVIGADEDRNSLNIHLVVIGNYILNFNLMLNQTILYANAYSSGET